jgi:hypothetical protein
MQIMLAEPGGLLGTYYDNVWFLNAPTFTRVDPNINFQWYVCGGVVDYYIVLLISWWVRLECAFVDGCV